VVKIWNNVNKIAHYDIECFESQRITMALFYCVYVFPFSSRYQCFIELVQEIS
jgi:hypothetical protein